MKTHIQQAKQALQDAVVYQRFLGIVQDVANQQNVPVNTILAEAMQSDIYWENLRAVNQFMAVGLSLTFSSALSLTAELALKALIINLSEGE